MKIRINISPFVIGILIAITFTQCTNSSNQKILGKKDIIYNLINAEYKEILEQDSFPLNLYEHPLSPVFCKSETDSIRIDSIIFVFEEKNYYNQIDTSFLWNNDSLPGFKVLSTSTIKTVAARDWDYFEQHLGKGYVIISIPLLDISGQYALIRQCKTYNSFPYDSPSPKYSYLLFTRIKDKWILVKTI